LRPVARRREPRIQTGIVVANAAAVVVAAACAAVMCVQRRAGVGFSEGGLERRVRPRVVARRPGVILVRNVPDEALVVAAAAAGVSCSGRCERGRVGIRCHMCAGRREWRERRETGRGNDLVQED
jgi:hypothetical protein